MIANANNPTGAPGSIRTLRMAVGLSQEALARAADCSTAYVRVLERGYAPDPELAPTMRRVLAVLNDASPAITPGSVKDPRGDRGHVEG